MKKNILLFVLFNLFAFSFLQAQNQYEIQFVYDSAGNQTSRDRVCINCGTSKTAIDSTAITKLDEKAEIPEEIKLDSGVSEIHAYPNPVTEVLRIEWVSPEKTVQKVILFSGIGKQLIDINIRANQSTTDLSFRQYPTGGYIVMVLYSDNTKQSFHVLKK